MWKKFKNLFCVIKKFGYLIMFIISIFIIFLFKGFILRIVSPPVYPVYLIINCIIFIMLIVLFIVFIIKYLIKKIKSLRIKKINKIDFVFLGFVVVFSFFFVFVLLKKYIIFPSQFRWVIGNVFIKEVFNQTLGTVDPKTYGMVLYSILQTVFHIKITPMTVLGVNKVISFFLLIVVFLISKTVFKNNLISLIVYATFISYHWVKYNLSSISYTILSIFFAYISILFLFNYMKDKDITSFILSNISIVLASYYRYELVFLFGVPYIAYFCIFLSKDKRVKKYMSITIAILIFILVSFLNHWISFTDDVVTQGRIYNTGTVSLFQIIGNSLNVLKNNILIEKDLLLPSWYISLFTYSGFIISLIITINLVYGLIKRKEIKSNYKLICIFAFYNLFYAIFLLSFNIQGMRSAFKYSVQYYLCELIVSYYGILWLVKKIVSKRKFIASIAKYSSLLLFLFIAVKSSYVLSFGVKPIVNIDSGFLEMELLLKNIVLDESCKIIKVNADQPNIDYYFGLQQNTVFFGPDSFYEKLKNYHKKGVCFYYHHKDYSEGDVIRDDKHRVDVKRVDELFNSCNKTIEFESPWEIRPFTLIRYDC